MDLHESLKLTGPTGEVTEQLLSDIQECLRYLNSRPWNQFWRRMYVRTAFAMIEGINNFMKQVTFSFHERNVRPLYERFRVLNITAPPLFTQIQPDGELLLLLEKTTVLKENGKCHVKDAFMATDASIRFMFDMHKRVFQTGYTPDYSVKAWGDLKAGLLVRHRLTHPKNDTDLNVTEDEASIVSRGCQWYIDHVTVAGNNGSAVIQEFEANLERFLTSLPKTQFLMHAQISGFEVPSHLWAADKLRYGPDPGNEGDVT